MTVAELIFGMEKSALTRVTSDDMEDWDRYKPLLEAMQEHPSSRFELDEEGNIEKSKKPSVLLGTGVGTGLGALLGLLSGSGKGGTAVKATLGGLIGAGINAHRGETEDMEKAIALNALRQFGEYK